MKKKRSDAEESLQDTHLEFIKAYWLGYIAFLEELSGEAGKWQKFSQQFDATVRTSRYLGPESYFTFGINYESSNTDRLTDANKSRLLIPVFLVHYALGTFFQESSLVTPAMRINALLLWQQIDPEMQFFAQAKYGREYIRKMKAKDLLPETFGEAWMPDQEVDTSQFFENKTIGRIFGPGGDNYYRSTWTQESYQAGLQVLLTNHKQELIQVLHSLLIVNGNPTFIKMTLRMMVKLADYSNDQDFNGLVFGQHASYRNSGRVTLVLDDLPLLAKETLVTTTREQRKRLREMEIEKEEEEKSFTAKLAQVKKGLIEDKARCFLAGLHTQVDVRGWFRTFRINPFVSFHENQEVIRQVYRLRALDLHPDKHSTASEEEKARLSKQMLQLNEAYESLTEETKYNEYLNQCFQRALAISHNAVVAQFGASGL